MGKAVNPFDLTDYAGGGQILKPGRYHVDRSVYTIYDFNGKGDPTLCHMLELQPLNAKGKSDGEPSVRYWSLGEGVSGINPIKGQKGCWSGIELDDNSEYDKLWKGSDHFVFMEHLAKAEFDMDKGDNDITVLEGLDANFDLITIKMTPRKGDDVKDDKKGGKKKPARTEKDVVVITSINEAGTSSGSGKGKEKEEPEEKEKPSKSKKGSEEPDEILATALGKVVFVKANHKGVTKLSAKMDVRNWMRETDVESDKAKEVLAAFADAKVLSAICKASGWQVDGDEIKPED